MAAEQQDGQVGVGCRQLQPAGRHRRDLADLGDDGGRSSVANGILDDCKERSVVAWLGVDHVGRHEPGLRDPGRIEVATAAHPQHRSADMACLASGDACEEERGSRIIAERTGPRGNLVKRSCAQPTTRQAAIECIDAERHCPVIRQRRGERAKMREAL